MRNALITSMAIIALAARGYGQTPTETPAPTPQQRDAEAARVGQQLALFSEDLRRAVSVGASAMVRQVRQESPRAELEFAHPVEVEYFRLEEGDLFFRVRVPTMLPTLRYAMELERARRPGGTVTPTNLGPTAPGSNRTAQTVQVMPAAPKPYVDIDPDEVYTREVKSELLKTFIRRSAAIRIPPDRFLTVAARDDGRPNPNLPSSYTEFNTVYFSIKGRDLTNYHERRQSLEETEKLVIIREE